MKKIFFILAVILFVFSIVQAQTKYDLPKDAVIIETQAVTPERSLILWMQNPAKHPNESPSEEYTCPDETRGSYYTGKARVSLVDSETTELINTIQVTYGDTDSNDEIDIPYAINGGYFYKVPNSSKTQERKPQIMDLKDYNGDGKAFEFALFDKEACQGLATTLIGYSENQDKVIQYSVKLTSDGKTETVYWIDYLFSEKPVRNGFWKYQIDYRGRGGSLDRYEIHYDKASESFVGTLKSENS